MEAQWKLILVQIVQVSFNLVVKSVKYDEKKNSGQVKYKNKCSNTPINELHIVLTHQ